MAKIYGAIKTVSDQIKNATTAASNTAAIVGGNLGDIVDKIQEVDGAKVPTTTTVNGKPLSGDITLDAEDIGIATDLADKVSKSAAETIGGTKTFSVSPIIPTPDADMEAATKKYVDDTKATVDALLLNKADLVGGKIPTSQLPAYVDDVLEYANLAEFPATGETGKIYVALDTNLTYRWSGSAYIEISKSLALGETSSTAYRGDRGKTAYDHSRATGNAHSTTAAQIPNTPAGTIAATTVQGAINELDGDVAQVRADLNTTNYNVEGLKGKTVADEEVSWLLPNDIDYFTGTYGNKNLGLYTKKMINPISFSKVRLNSVSHNGNLQYKICIVNGNTDKRDCPIGPIADGTHLVIKSGTILMTTTAKDIYVDLGGVFTCPTGSQVVIYMSSLVSLNIYAKGASGGIGNQEKTSNAVLFSSSTNPLDGGTWSVGSVNETTNFGYYSCALTLITSPTFAKLSDFNILKNIVDSLPSNNVDISLPDKIYAIVGDKLQLFYRGIIKAPNPYIYDILVSCQKGIQYPRYFEYLPTSGDVGTTTFKIEVKNKDGVILGTKTCSLITKSVVQSPLTIKKVLCVGDSLTSAGIWCIEASRRLIGFGGAPLGLALSNIAFSGRKTGSGIGWEGTGGWTWSSYATSGVAAYRFYVSGVVTPPAIGAVYTNNGGTFTVSEINITGGTGNIRCTSVGTPSASGILTKSSGIGDNTIAFSSSAADSGNPFWQSGKLNFSQYVDTYMDGGCDVIYFLLTWNGQTPWRTDFTSMITTAKILIDHIHTQYPNCKVKIMGIQVPSLNGGMGANYGATGTGYADMYGMVVTAMNMNKAYQDWCNEAAYSSFMEFVNVSSQFDSENNMPETDKAVNTRAAKTEKIGTNGVHPSTEGYYQIGDVVFRNFVANFCQ